ncbi:uncharacterized protein LOC130735344 [Lotus japonicus]|uniref:uncharacterized protein LOC130715024 n=1 Tax=Lotus japonicus TaxID=34305 RepID=UPI0025841C40|nr:uncharacterized protein LOC130715024 [Lotus japonicus]XP_057431748.1 uncharacterized protein LOC130724526 [Lotus japonicus]XP_057440085.1 uncharacterized protein LOC130731943 [Lotus japonicus]XP_057443366.1 uncharacterized protein LOC130735344 [Lotus japonicus]
MRRAPGRPKKKRVRAADEPRDPHKLQRFQSTVFCGNCRRAGHNIRSCKAKTAADIVIPPGGNKKQKKKTKEASGSGTTEGATTQQPPLNPTNGASQQQPQGASQQPPQGAQFNVGVLTQEVPSQGGSSRNEVGTTSRTKKRSRASLSVVET